MKLPEDVPVVDFSEGFDPAQFLDGVWGMGGYAEHRPGMYTAPQYRNERNIHMGFDVWAPPDESVYAFSDGQIAYMHNHNQIGNYGPTLVVRHTLTDKTLFALYGHLSEATLQQWAPGDRVEPGDLLGRLGTVKENGGWVPHLHLQLCNTDPGEADMPGVVAKRDLEKALKIYPDPGFLFGL
ncbi:MAG: peptidoglycan DD-metalloendopeptidase family protein [Balneolaceae bacterium]